VTGGSSGGSVFTGTVTFKPSSGDAYTVYSTSGTLGLAHGYNSSGTVGGYLYDEVNAGYVYEGATKNGITFTGTVTAGGFTTSGSISIGSTLYGPGQTNYIQFAANPWDIVIAPGANNWTYFNAAKNAHVDNTGIFNGAGLSVSGTATANEFSGPLSGDVLAQGTTAAGARSTYNGTNVWVQIGGWWATISPTVQFGYYDSSNTFHSGFQVGPGGVNVNGLGVSGQFVQSNSSIMGFKNSGGGKLAEMKGDGTFIIAGGTYYTATSTYAYSANGAFDAFDYAETYPLDAEYETGTVVCPGPHEAFTRCMHDNCHAASVVSLAPAFCAGGGRFDRFSDDEPEDTVTDEHVAPLALVGRVRIRTRDVIRAGDLVCSDGNGGVRRARPGEEAFTLGYALHGTHEGRVGVYLRPMWCRVPRVA